MSVSSVKAGEAFIELTARDSKLVKGLAAAQAKLRAFSDSVNSLGRDLLRYSAAMAIPFALATKKFADFDDQMRLVQGITGITDAELKKLTETAKKLGRETSYTAAQVAAGMVVLSRMGFTAKETNRSISDIMNLDRATGLNDLALSAEIASAAMRAFGLTAADSSRIADVLTATANGSSQSLMDLGEALKMAAPNAHQANASLEDTAALLGVLANMGIKGTMAGTALAKTFQRLAAGKGVDVLAGKGIRTTDAAGNLRSMRDILIEIAAVTEKMGSAEKIAFLTDVFDVRGAKGGGLISGNIKSLDEMIKKIADSGGIAKKTAEQMDSGIGGTFRKLWSAIEGVAIEIGNAIANYIKPFTDSVSGLLNGLAKWIQTNNGVIHSMVRLIAQTAAAAAGLILFAKALKIAALGLAAIKIAVSAAVISFSALQAVILSLAAAGPLAFSAFASLMAAAFLSVVSSIDTLSGTVDDLRAGFTEAFASIKSVIASSLPVIKDALSMGDLSAAVDIAFKALKVSWLQGIMPLRKLWYDFALGLRDAWTSVSGSIRQQASGLWYGLLEGLKQIGNSIADAWDSIWTSIINDFTSVIAEIKKAWIAFKGTFDSSIDVAAEFRKIDSDTRSSARERWKNTHADTDRRENELQQIRRQGRADRERIENETQADYVLNRKGYEASLRNAEQELKSAREEWKKAMDDARKKVQEAAEKNAAEDKKPEIRKIAENLQQQTDTKTVAGFDTRAVADALRGSGEKDKTAERTASATESVAKTVQKMYTKLENGEWLLS